MLRDRTTRSRRACGDGPVGGVHYTVHARLLRDRLLAISFRSWRHGRGTGDAASVPNASDVVAGNDLGEATRFDMPDFDKAAVEQEYVWWMPRDVFGGTFPFDGAHRPTRVSVTIHVETKFYAHMGISGHLDAFRVQLTIITKQELVVTGTEHAHGPTALASLGQLLKSRVIPLRDRDTLETAGHVRL